MRLTHKAQTIADVMLGMRDQSTREILRAMHELYEQAFTDGEAYALEEDRTDENPDRGDPPEPRWFPPSGSVE